MIVKIFLISLMTWMSLAKNTYTPSTDGLLLKGLLPILNIAGDLYFDGPYSVSNAPVPSTAYKIPTKKQVEYYAYVASAPFYGYDLEKLTCEPCSRFRNDVCQHKVFRNVVHDTLSLVYVSKKRNEIVVSFRGSLNVWNNVLDLLFFNVNQPGVPSNIRVHTGFYIATMSLYDQVVREVGRLRKEFPKYKIVITGHSLGASMARLFTFFLLHLNQFPNAVYELYTYGELRVGNKDFADFMNNQPITTARVVSRADLFTHLPPTSILSLITLGDYFVHCGPEFWINGKDDQKFCNGTVYEDRKCSNSLGPLYSLSDHFLYFDNNMVNSMGQPLQYLELPFGLFQPTKVLPPLPEPIDELIGTVTDLAVPLLTIIPLAG